MTREELVGVLNRLVTDQEAVIASLDRIHVHCPYGEIGRTYGNAINALRGLVRLQGIAQADHAQSVIEALDEMRRKREEVLLNEYAPLIEHEP